MAIEWSQDILNYVTKSTLMAYKIPKVLPGFDINDGGTVRRYSEEKIYNLNRFTTNVTEHHFEMQQNSTPIFLPREIKTCFIQLIAFSRFFGSIENFIIYVLFQQISGFLTKISFIPVESTPKLRFSERGRQTTFVH